MIQEALRAGLIERPEDALDVGLVSLRERLDESPSRSGKEPDHREPDLVEVSASVSGLADDLNFSRNPSTARFVDP